MLDGSPQYELSLLHQFLHHISSDVLLHLFSRTGIFSILSCLKRAETNLNTSILSEGIWPRAKKEKLDQTWFEQATSPIFTLVSS